jgi:type IV pilus biogenesis protein CpaD/CtpE
MCTSSPSTKGGSGPPTDIGRRRVRAAVGVGVGSICTTTCGASWLGSRAIRIDIVRYVCASPECRATWRVLPAFVARHLWRRWPTVARTIAGDPAGEVAVLVDLNSFTHELP